MTPPPDCDRNLRFGVVALHLKMITAHQFAEACSAWHVRATGSLADLLVERGWLTPDQRDTVEGLLGGISTRPADEVLPATIDVRASDHERYAPLSYHASGSMGDVWLAHDRQLGRDVAMKKLRLEHAFDPGKRSRFAQEALITGQLDHPGVVPVYELSCPAEGDLPFYAMRFVRGRTLADAARAYHDCRREGREESFELPTLLTAFVTVCNTVGYAHSQGVIHRDLKPANIVLGDFGEAVVLDWGLAKRLRQRDEESAGVPGALADGESDVTRLGDVIGTPAYMAPEQAAGRHDLVDERTDVYGLGAILYAVLTGRPPFDGRDVSEVLRRVQEDVPVPPRSSWPEVPPGLEAICLRALAKDRAARWSSATELGQQVQGWQESQRLAALEALRESEERFRLLADAIPQIVWTGLEGSVADYFNQRAVEYSGLTAEELKQRWRETVHPDDLARVDEKFASGQAAGAGSWFEYRIRRADGDYRWHLVCAMPVPDACGRAVRWFGTCTDIEDRKRMEEELRLSRERYELAARASQDGLWDWDTKTNQVYYSPGFKALMGYADHELPNRAEEWRRRLHPEDRERVLDTIRRLINSDVSYSAQEYRLLHKDGKYRWILGQGVALRDAEGKVYRAAGSDKDITELKLKEETLVQMGAELARARRRLAELESPAS